MNKKFYFILLLTISVKCLLGQYNTVVLDYHTEVKVENQKLITDYSILIQINDKESNWISDIEIPYSTNEKFKLIEAVILDSEGNLIRELQKKEIVTKSDISKGTLYEENYLKEFKLKWHEYPYRIKYTYQIIKNEFLYVSKWHPLIKLKVPVKKASLNIHLPLTYKVNMDYSDALKFKSNTLNNRYILNWEIENIAAITEQIYAPPLAELIPCVTVVPNEFSYEQKGEFKSWNSYGQWQFELNKKLDKLPKTEKSAIDTLLVNVKNNREKINILYNYLQINTRYINVTLGIGGLKPSPASQICKTRYGDCKALTNYMKALLNHIGIESFYTKIYAGDNPVKIKQSLPSQQFNHVILCIPLEGDTIWLENTSSCLPFNYLGTFMQNRYGLLVKDSSSTLVKTPTFTHEDVLEESLYKIELNEKDTGSVIISNRLKGMAFEKFMHLKHEGTKIEQEIEIGKFLTLKNFEIISWDFQQTKIDSPTLKMNIELNIKNQLRRIGDNILVPPIPIGIPKFEDIERRNYPVRINYPINKRTRIEYNFSFLNQFNIKLPQEVEIENKYGRYSEKYTLENGKIILQKEFQLNKGSYLIKEYPEFFSFIKSITDAEKMSSILLKNK